MVAATASHCPVGSSIGGRLQLILPPSSRPEYPIEPIGDVEEELAWLHLLDAPLIQPVKPIITGSDVALLIRRRGPTWNGSVDLPSTLTTPKPLLTSVKLEARSTAHHSGEGVTPREESRVTLGEQDERAVDLSRDNAMRG